MAAARRSTERCAIRFCVLLCCVAVLKGFDPKRTLFAACTIDRFPTATEGCVQPSVCHRSVSTVGRSLLRCGQGGQWPVWGGTAGGCSHGLRHGRLVTGTVDRMLTVLTVLTVLRSGRAATAAHCRQGGRCSPAGSHITSCSRLRSRCCWASTVSTKKPARLSNSPFRFRQSRSLSSPSNLPFE